MKKKKFIKQLYHTEEFSVSFLKWFIIALLIGLFGGLIGTAFRVSVLKCNDYFISHMQLVFFLPLSGLLIVFLYHRAGFKNPLGTNRIIKSARNEEKIPLITAPLIFAATVITHFFGGSAGREGAALQIGGTIGYAAGNIAKLHDTDRGIAVMAGMAAVFSALFGVPVTSVVFALEVISVGIIHYSGLVPCLVSSFSSFVLSKWIYPFSPVGNHMEFPKFDIPLILWSVLAGLCCAGLSIIFVLSLDGTRELFRRIIKNPYIRIATGGCIIILLTVIFSSGRYNGSGVFVIKQALSGSGRWYDFLLKILFTSITLGVGFKGGEIVPTLFIGASMGCVLGGIIGIDPGMCAALCMCGTFCGAVNCPIASLAMGIEIFGGNGLPYFAVCCFVSYMMSGYFGLYESQKIVYSKLHGKEININTKG